MARKNFALVALFMLTFFVASCSEESSFLGGIEEEYISNPSKGDEGNGNTTFVVSENGYVASFGTRLAELYTKEQVLTLSLKEIDDLDEVVKTTTLKHDLDLNALFTVPATVYVDSVEALANVELLEEGEVSSNVERSTEDGIARMTVNRGFSFTFNEGEVVEAHTLYQKESTDTIEFAFTALRSVEFESFEARKAIANADSIVYDVTLQFIVSLYRNGEEEKVDEYAVEVPYQRVYHVEKTDEPTVEEPKDEPKDEPTVEEPKDEPKDEPTVEEPKDEPKDEPTVEEPKDEPKDEPTVEEPKDEPKDEPKEEPKEEPKNEPEQPKPAIEKNIPESWGAILGMGVSAAPADDVDGQYAVWTWCLRTTKGAVVVRTAEGQMPTVQSFLNGYFVQGNFDASYNGGYFTTSRNAYGLPVGVWAPAQAYTDGNGVHYSYLGHNVANVWDVDLRIWGWRGGNYTTVVNGFNFTVDQFGVLFINGQAFAR